MPTSVTPFMMPVSGGSDGVLSIGVVVGEFALVPLTGKLPVTWVPGFTSIVIPPIIRALNTR